MRNQQNEKAKGITLIALIITVIVMLILVGVSVSILINSNLIGVTEDAGEKTKTAYEQESNMGAITIGDTTYGSIEEYIQSVNKTWKVIYDDGGTTTGGQLLISQDLVFEDGATYRITVESEEFTGEVTAQAIYVDTYASYLLFLIEDNKSVTFNSMSEISTKLQEIDSETFCVGQNVTGAGSGIGFVIGTIMGTPSCEYTIKKVEKEVGNEKLIYEGTLELPCYELETSLKASNRYKIVGTIDGEPFTTILRYENACLAGLVGEEHLILGFDRMLGAGTWGQNIIINEIYDLGKSNYKFYKEENGFGIGYDGDSWELISTPNTDYIVPQKVDGITVEAVRMDLISGNPIFNHVVSLYDLDVATVNKITINVNDSDFNNAVMGYLNVVFVIDLTGCGDELEFSETALNELRYYEGNNRVVYVTQAVKNKYPGYTVLQVKSE